MLRTEDFAFMAQQATMAVPAAEQQVVFLHYDHTDPGDKPAGLPPTPVYSPSGGTTLPAVVHVVSLAVEDRLGGQGVAGDVVFQIRQSVLTTEPTGQDRITWHGRTYEPVQVTPAGPLFWVLRCRKL